MELDHNLATHLSVLMLLTNPNDRTPSISYGAPMAWGMLQSERVFGPEVPRRGQAGSPTSIGVTPLYLM